MGGCHNVLHKSFVKTLIGASALRLKMPFPLQHLLSNPQNTTAVVLLAARHCCRHCRQCRVIAIHVCVAEQRFLSPIGTKPTAAQLRITPSITIPIELPRAPLYSVVLCVRAKVPTPQHASPRLQRSTVTCTSTCYDKSEPISAHFQEKLTRTLAIPWLCPGPSGRPVRPEDVETSTRLQFVSLRVATDEYCSCLLCSCRTIGPRGSRLGYLCLFIKSLGFWITNVDTLVSVCIIIPKNILMAEGEHNIVALTFSRIVW